MPARWRQHLQNLQVDDSGVPTWWWFTQVPSRDRPSTVIAFAQKTFKDGNLTSKLHVIELGAPAGA